MSARSTLPLFQRALCLLALITGVAAAEDHAGATKLRDAQLADLAIVRKDYLPKELAYTPATRAQAQARLQALEQRAGALTPADLLVGLAQVGALTDNAHSGIRYHDPRALPPKRLPLRLLWFPDGLFVARAYGDAADLAGAEVLSIEGRSPQALYLRAKSLNGGSEINRKKYLTEFIESAGVLHALGLAAAPDRLNLELRLRSGERVRREVTMLSSTDTPATAELERLWSPQPLPGERGWTAALDADAAPLYLRDADAPFRMLPLPQLDALYLQLRTNEDADGYPIADYLKRVEDELKRRPPSHLIVDLRFDVGGNLLTTLGFMRALPGRVRGRTYLLVGRYTYSAGIVSAAAVKQGGGERVTVVGDELGDRLAFWSEGGMVSLPNSGLGLRYTNGTFDLKDGCSAKPECLDKLINVNFVSLKPAIAAPLTATAWLEQRDPAMDAVQRDLARRGAR